MGLPTVFALERDAAALDQLHAAVRRGRAQAGQPRHQRAGAVQREAVNVFCRGDGLDDLVGVDVFGQRHLHQDAVDGRVGVQRGDTRQQRFFAQRGFVLLQHRVQAVLGAGLDLVAHVDGAGRVFAHQDDGQPGLAASRGEGRGARGDFGAQLLGEGGAVEDLGGHGVRSLGTGRVNKKGR
jgi:hypothetical protein